MARLKASQLKKINKVLASSDLFQIINEYFVANNLGDFEVHSIKIVESNTTAESGLVPCSQLDCGDDDKITVTSQAGIAMCRCRRKNNN